MSLSLSRHSLSLLPTNGNASFNFTPLNSLETAYCFELFCNVLKYYCITAIKLVLTTTYEGVELTVKQWVALLKILQPMEVYLDSKGSHRFKTLLQAKELVSPLLFV